jgi:hypothetical protein
MEINGVKLDRSYRGRNRSVRTVVGLVHENGGWSVRYVKGHDPLRVSKRYITTLAAFKKWAGIK